MTRSTTALLVLALGMGLATQARAEQAAAPGAAALAGEAPILSTRQRDFRPDRQRERAESCSKGRQEKNFRQAGAVTLQIL